MRTVRCSLLALACALGAELWAQAPRLTNLSTRAQAGGDDALITGFTIGPGLRKTVLLRAVGPALGGFGVGGALADPKLELYAGSLKIAENDNWTMSDAGTFAGVGAFAFAPGSRDAALVATLDPGSYTAQVTGLPAGAAAGVALVEVYEVTGGATRLLNLSTRARVGTGANLLIPGISVSPGGGTRRLLLRAVGPTLATFNVPGALADPRLELFSANGKVAENDQWSAPIVAGAATPAQLSAAFTEAGAFPLVAGSDDAALLVELGAGSYTLQVSGAGETTGVTLVEVYDLTPASPAVTPNASLYIAQLRPDASATSSMASGFATIAFDPDGASARVDVTFSNLTSAQTNAHLLIGNTDFVLTLRAGQVTNQVWLFAPTAGRSTADLIAALNTGHISVRLDTTRFPAGELRGTFLQSYGSRTFTPPAMPPALPTDALTRPTQTDAARFLTQATFGPTLAEINALTAQGISAWLDAQFALPPSLHLPAARSDALTFPNVPPPGKPEMFIKFDRHNRHAAWWKIAITAPDQLRQRVAFALSQILVVSEKDDQLNVEAEALARYYDHLVTGAFGNFRSLLETVTLSPVMGRYLSHLNNRKGDPSRGTLPDENYAREVQQLFSIGLVQLQPDGTLLLDADGLPIPTYNQSMVSETAKILTGWSFIVGQPVATQLNGAPDDHSFLNPMANYDESHDTTEKRIVSLQQVQPAAAAPTVVPAGQSGPQDLAVLLDTLHQHPNTGPFISRQLIQRIVTSNPSPGYVYRVAQVFANDGTGRRGNLGEVVRAILTDYEARSPAATANVGYGKLKEPLLRVTALFRALNARAANGRFLDSYAGEATNGNLPRSTISMPQNELKQGALSSPTVFNFFMPDFVVPGPLAAAGLVAPEMQITDASTAIRVPSLLGGYINRSEAPTYPDRPPVPVPAISPYLFLDFSNLSPLATSPAALIDRLNLLFCANSLSSAARAEILASLQAYSTPLGPDLTARFATHLVALCPDAVVQK